MYFRHPSSQHTPLYVFLVSYTVAMNSLVAGLTAVAALSSELPASRTVGVALSSEQQDCQGIPSGLPLLECQFPNGKRSRTGDLRRAARVEEKSNFASAEKNIERYNQNEILYIILYTFICTYTYIYIYIYTYK